MAYLLRKKLESSEFTQPLNLVLPVGGSPAVIYDLDISENARRELKNDMQELNEKIIILEEELYESKTIQLDLLDQVKLLEEKLLKLMQRKLK